MKLSYFTHSAYSLVLTLPLPSSPLSFPFHTLCLFTRTHPTPSIVPSQFPLSLVLTLPLPSSPLSFPFPSYSPYPFHRPLSVSPSPRTHPTPSIVPSQFPLSLVLTLPLPSSPLSFPFPSYSPYPFHRPLSVSPSPRTHPTPSIVPSQFPLSLVLTLPLPSSPLSFPFPNVRLKEQLTNKMAIKLTRRTSMKFMSTDVFTSLVISSDVWQRNYEIQSSGEECHIGTVTEEDCHSPRRRNVIARQCHIPER